MVDYKKMSADELIHLISNKALNKNMKENDKLVIQDCCKELFKKKETIAKYKKIKYVKSKYYWSESDETDNIHTKIKSRIVQVVSDIDEDPIPFPEKIHHKVLERLEKEKYIVFGNCCDTQQTFTILEVEDT
tara:strand:- start:692 stop:1087 length:396 start_codon:yes stop_codon:yes gene_type:complete